MVKIKNFSQLADALTWHLEVQIYGEDILETVKGYEYKEKFVTETLPFLEVTTPEAYYALQYQFKLFVNNEVPSVDVSSWLDWRYHCRELKFCAFALTESPSTNLGEVVHAGWKNRERMGMFLLYACFLMLGIAFYCYPCLVD